MKLLKTITNVISEVENEYYELSSKEVSEQELKSLDQSVDDSLKLLEIYRKFQKD